MYVTDYHDDCNNILMLCFVSWRVKMTKFL